MHTYFLAPVFLSAVTASPLQDFSPLGYVLPSSGQPNDAPNAFQDFFARTSTNPDSYIQPQIQAKSLGERLGGDPASGNEAIPHSAASQYLQSDLKFQRAPCGATSSVCCQRAYNGESSQSATCAAKNRIRFAGSDRTPMMDSTNANFGRYCLEPQYFTDCSKTWLWVWGTTGYDCYTACEPIPGDRGPSADNWHF